MAEITFLAPGSCQLEVTAEGTTGTDTGVDLASVSWTIEQALIAGCRFSPSAGDVHIDRNGVLTIGRSLFDRINQADGDENIPGQCTLIIRADSTITKTVLDRFKVLVGYPGEGGGSGGGEATSDFLILNLTQSTDEQIKAAIPSDIWYYDGSEDWASIQFDETTYENDGSTFHGVIVKDCPVGACLLLQVPNYTVENASTFYDGTDIVVGGYLNLMRVDNHATIGSYTLRIPV